MPLSFLNDHVQDKGWEENVFFSKKGNESEGGHDTLVTHQESCLTDRDKMELLNSIFWVKAPSAPKRGDTLPG